MKDLNNKNPLSKRLDEQGNRKIRNKGVEKLTYYINTILQTLHEYPFEVDYIILKFQPVVLYPRAMPGHFNASDLDDTKFNCDHLLQEFIVYVQHQILLI